MARELDLVYQGTGTLYAIVRRVSDGYAWNGSAFEAFVNANVATYDVPLASQGGDYYAVDFPAGITTAGAYRVQYYEQAGGTPAITDLLLSTEELYWNGSAVASAPSSDNLSTLTLVKYHLNIASSVTTYDTQLTAFLQAASRAVEKYCNRLFVSATRTATVDGRGCFVELEAYPVTALTSVETRLTQADDWETEEADDYERDDDAGTIWGCFPKGLRNVRVVYVGGYTTLPDDLQNAVAMLVAQMWRARSVNGALKSERLGDYSYQNFDPSDARAFIGGDVAMLLGAYKRPQVSFA